MGQSPPQPGGLAMQRQASGQGAPRPPQGQQGSGGGHSRKGSQGVPQHLQSAPMQMYPTMPSGSMGLPPGLQQQVCCRTVAACASTCCMPKGGAKWFLPSYCVACSRNDVDMLLQGGGNSIKCDSLLAEQLVGDDPC